MPPKTKASSGDQPHPPASSLPPSRGLPSIRQAPPAPHPSHWSGQQLPFSGPYRDQHLPAAHYHTQSSHHHSPGSFPGSGSTRTSQLPSIRDHPPPSPMVASEANSPSSESQDSRDDDRSFKRIHAANHARGASSSSNAPHNHNESTSADTSSTRSGNRRQRVHFSCTECHRRKQKCNRQTPCQHCIARKVPERCKTFQPGQDDNLDLHGRVNKLERTVEEGFDRIMSMLQDQQRLQQQTVPSHPPIASAIVSQPPPQTALYSQDRRQSSTRPFDSTAGETSEGDEANDGAQLNASGGFHGSGAGVAMKIDSLLSGVTGTTKHSGPAITLPMRDSEAGDLNSRMIEYGAADRLSDALMSSVPSKEICTELIEHYFKNINWLSQPFPERYLRPLFDAFINPTDGYKFPPPLTTTNINVFACIMCMISIAALSIDSEIFPSGARARRLAARRYEWAGRRALLVSQVLGKDDIVQVLSFHLAWRFMMIDRRISEGWSCSCAAVHAAFSIGLHRDGSKLGLEQQETDLRRGVWWMVRFADYVLALNLGRPPLSDPSGTFSDTGRPSLEGLQHWWPYDHPSTHPDAKPDVPFPTIYQHGYHRIELTKVCGKIVEIYQQMKPHHYSDVLALDAELLRARRNLPYYYQAKVDSDGKVICDMSLDAHFPMLLVHRFLMFSEYFMVRINLHRSYLLRSGAKGAGGQRFVPSRRACVESALEDLVMRHHFVSLLKKTFHTDRVPMTYYIHIGTYSWFNSLLVASIASIIDPSMPEIPAVRDHINRFLQLTETIKGNDAKAMELKDEMRDREAKILSMFVTAIDKVQAARQSAPSSKEVGTKRARQEDGSHSKRSKHDKSRNSSSSSLGAANEGSKASREEATADVLLGLGKGDHDGSGHRQASSSGSNAQQRQANTPAANARSSGSIHQRSTPRGDASSPETGTSQLPSHSSMHTHSGSHSTPNTYHSNLSGDSPNSQVVDAAQADLNAWFQKEFVGGTFFDHTLNGLGLPDGSAPSVSNQFDTPSANGTSANFTNNTAPNDDRLFGPRVGDAYGQGGFGREVMGGGSTATGTPINFGGHMAFAPPDGATATAAQRPLQPPQVPYQQTQSQQQQQQQQQTQSYPSVQWSTLPQPAWGNSTRGQDVPPSYTTDTSKPGFNPGGDVGMGAYSSGAAAGGIAIDSAAAGAVNGEGAGGVPSFDPNFWAELIDKIST